MKILVEVLDVLRFTYENGDFGILEEFALRVRFHM